MSIFKIQFCFVQAAVYCIHIIFGNNTWPLFLLGHKSHIFFCSHKKLCCTKRSQHYQGIQESSEKKS